MARTSIFTRIGVQTTEAATQNETTDQESSFSVLDRESLGDFSVECSSGDKIPLKMYNVEPICVDTINDTEGRLYQIVKEYENSLGSISVPLELTNILPQVKSLREYDIYRCGNYRFATCKFIRKDVISEWEARIVKSIEEGLLFECSILEPIVAQGRTLNNLVLTACEQSYLVSRFRNYNACVLYLEDKNDILLRVNG